MEHTKKIANVVDNMLQIVWGVAFLLFPLLFLTYTTDAFVLPKEILIGIAALLSLVIISIQTVLQRKIQMRQTVLDLPIGIFLVTIILSAIFSVNRFESLIATVPYIFLAITYFVLINFIKKEQTAFFLIASLVVSGCAAALISLFSYFKVYLLPIPATHIQSFTTFGSLFDTAIYLVGILCISLFFAAPIIKGKSNAKSLSFAVASLLIIAGLGTTIYQLVTTQKPIILPFLTGFQIAFATISQDTARVVTSFFFGSGIGSFTTDFTRFHPAMLNGDNNIWYLLFPQSSSFVLQILATTGILGLLAFFFIIGKAFTKFKDIRRNPLFLSMLVLFVACFLMPFSFTSIALLFFVLALFSSIEGLKHAEKGVDLEFILVSLRKTFFGNQKQQSSHPSIVMPIIFAILLLAIAGVLGFYSTKYVIADVLFNQSYAAANNNNGSITYQKQADAINIFPYNDSYYRIFAQTNIAIANSLVALNARKNSSPSSDVQNTALNLVQQAITMGRTAATLSPLTASNWQNLGSIYRALIGVGDGADKFAIASYQQAILLDPNNPQEYIALGGLYYQLQQYDNAIRQFQTAANLKPDYSNAYYNLGHAYEAKGDLQSALQQYQNVKSLVGNNKDNLQKITTEIETLQAKIGTQGQKQAQQPTPTQQPTGPSANQEPLNLALPTGTR
jgi:Tfp pilus assembly protein PilF